MYKAGLNPQSPGHFCMTTFSASLTNLTALLPHSRDYSHYVRRPILAPPPLWLQEHAELRARDLAHSTDMWHQPRLINVTCEWNGRLSGVNPTIQAASLTNLTALLPQSRDFL